MSERKLILYIACSLDGYIAGPDGDLSFLESVQQPGEDYGYKVFNEQTDTVIMGRKTFDKIMSFGIPFPHKDKEKVYIITRSDMQDYDNITFYGGSLLTLIKNLKQQPGKQIYCDGGGELVQALFQYDLFDEIILSIIPVYLGKGIRLFREQDNVMPLKLSLKSCKNFPSGLVQLYYSKS